MAGFLGFTGAHTYQCLDEEFDAPDIVADHDLCRAIATGKRGLHPDAWGNHDPLATLPPHFRKPWRPPIGFPADEPVAELADWPKPTPRPKPSFAWRTYPVSGHTTGEVQLTCDECGKARLGLTVCHGEQGRPAAVAAIRAMGRDAGWTFIVGRDRCPKCSQLVPPQAIGNGAGGHQGDEQHP